MTNTRIPASDVGAFFRVIVNTFARGLHAMPAGNQIVLQHDGDESTEWVAAIGYRNESRAESTSKTVSNGPVQRAKDYIEATPSDGRDREPALAFLVVDRDRTQLTVFILPLSTFEELNAEGSPVLTKDGKYRFYPDQMELLKDHPDILAAFRLKLA